MKIVVALSGAFLLSASFPNKAVRKEAYGSPTCESVMPMAAG